MEQPISPSSPPVPAAAIDPSFVPGFMPARAGTPAREGAEPEDVSADPVEVAPEDGTSDDSAPENEAPVSAPGDEDEDEGPAFEAADRRASAIADRSGVRLRQDDLEVDFDWKEIGAVEYDTSRFGRRLTVTVHMPNRHQYWVEVTAADKESLEGWTKQLDAVLDSHFQD
ncbi:hypothetical protein [Streptomyces sp. NPDC050738]|uniref:hypothetical protein n=1 Tax=Streptomyces sp. NPDC050738 TaxID=3154744 RepID=UPI003438AF2B